MSLHERKKILCISEYLQFKFFATFLTRLHRTNCEFFSQGKCYNLSEFDIRNTHYTSLLYHVFILHLIVIAKSRK